MATNKSSPLRAILESIEVEGGVENGKERKRSQYSVQISVDGAVVVKSIQPKPRSSVLKWEWNAGNEISFEPSSLIKVVVYRGFGTNITLFNGFVVQYEGKVEDLLDNKASFVLTNKKGGPVPAKMKIALSAASTSKGTGLHPGNLAPQDNDYVAVGGLLAVVADPETRVQRVGSVFYEGFKTVVEGLYSCSDIFLPLKTAAGGILTIIKFVEIALENKKELEDLKTKLEAILSIVKKYQKHDGMRALGHRIEIFCTAIAIQLKSIEEMQKHSLLARGAEGTKDADTILKAIRNINSLCDVFQIDTQLNIEEIVGDILQRLNSGSIEKLNHEMTSYKTRQSSYGDPTGCMEGTRVEVLNELDAWASNANSSKVYWMVGMAGIGKSTIAQTFCEILEAKNMLGGSFFASRASDKTNNARLIIPVLAHALARASPPIRIMVVKAIEDDPTLAEPTYGNMNAQFMQLIYNPIRKTAGMEDKAYKVLVVDAIDECVDPRVVSAFIRLVLGLASEFSLKVFISSRDESPIRNAFSSGDNKAKNFYLHEIEKDVVQKDIRKYLETSLANIRKEHPHSTAEKWPLQPELDGLIARSGTLFIYAATAIRYIGDGDEFYKSRLSEMAIQGLESVDEFQTDLDVLYVHILGKACKGKRKHEADAIRDLVSIIIFLRTPLPMEAIATLSDRNAHLYLSPLSSVIHIPNISEAVVAPFHASFPDFITDPKRCSLEHCPSFSSLVSSEGHQLLALKCLKEMNRSLKYNICEIPKELTLSRRETTNSLESVGKISEALKYSCLYWAAHLAEVEAFDNVLINTLHVFLHEHLLHWIECLSTLSELQTGLKSLGNISTVLLTFKFRDLQLLVDDAHRCLQMNFEAVKKHCMEIYESALVWIPNNSLIRKTYIADVGRVPRVVLGLSDSWGPAELIMQHGSMVQCITFSQDGSQVVSGSDDRIIRIWNVMTGKVEAELKGHGGSVRSVAFSQDGSQLVSGSKDKTVRIWNVLTGEVEAELRGHTGSVRSVAFSQDSSQVVSGSRDKTVRIWNVTTGKVEAELKGHTARVMSVAFSQDGSQVVSGSDDRTIRIWNVMTGKVEAELKGHGGSVRSVAFSQNSSQVVSGSYERTIRIWNVLTGEVKAELKGHIEWVMSVAFSQDSSRVVSGSDDKTVRIWNVLTGKVEAELRGHTGAVRSVAFSQDSSRVVSGSKDKTVRIWNVMTGNVEAELKGHTEWVMSVAFSQDGSQVVSGSDDKTVQIWNVLTGKVEAELKGHTDSVMSVAFSQDGSRVVSGSNDKTVRIWNVLTGRMEAELKGHTEWVMSVAFSQDGSQVISGSDDRTVHIWNVTTGEVEAELRGHTGPVKSVAFLQDGSRVVSGSLDNTVRIWNALTGEVEVELKGHTDSVMSVAFSQDGSQVVSGSDDKTLRIWNVATGNSQSMTTSSITLSDSSRVNKTAPGKFRISYLSQQSTPSMNSISQSSDNGHWILASLHDLWIPSEYRNFYSSSIWGSRICLGYPSGRVVIVDMTVAL